jgi:menaquinone-9 beta-reductase
MGWVTSLVVWLVVVVSAAVATFYCWATYWRRRNYSYKVQQNGPFKNITSPDGVYDVIIVGAGPAGSTAAYYLRQGLDKEIQNKPNKKVLLLERKRFPREKYCGDAWCHQALELLDEMEVLPRIVADGKCRAVERGGFVSPFGYTCVGGPYGSVSTIRTYAIKVSSISKLSTLVVN